MVVRRIAAVLGALVLVSGCSSGDEPPEVAPTPTVATGSPSNSPGPSTPSPDVGKPASARGFLHQWFQWYGELQRTGTSTEFLSSSPSCKACKATAQRFRRIYRSGGHIHGGEISLLRLRRIDRSPGRETWLVDIASTPTRYRESKGHPVATLKGGEATLRFDLAIADSGYQVSEYYQEAS